MSDETRVESPDGATPRPTSSLSARGRHASHGHGGDPDADGELASAEAARATARSTRLFNAIDTALGVEARCSSTPSPRSPAATTRWARRRVGVRDRRAEFAGPASRPTSWRPAPIAYLRAVAAATRARAERLGSERESDGADRCSRRSGTPTRSGRPTRRARASCSSTCTWSTRSPRRRPSRACGWPGAEVRRPDRTLATVDHNVPTDRARARASPTSCAQAQIEALERNAAEFGIPLFALELARTRASCTSSAPSSG